MYLKKLLVVAVAGLMAAAGVQSVVGASAASAATPSVKGKLLKLSDLPAGWNVNNDSGSSLSKSNCLKGIKSVPQGGSYASVSYVYNGNVPLLGEGLATGKGESSRWAGVNKHLAACKSLTITSGSKSYTATVGAMSFPHVGKQSAAYTLSVTVDNVNVGLDLVLFRAGNYVGLVEYGDIGSPDIPTVEGFVNEAIDKAEGKPLPSTAKGIYPMGSVASVPTTYNGIDKAAVYGFYPNITTDQPDVDTPPAGFSYGAVDAEECAGPNGASSGPDSSDFSVLLSNGSTAKSDFVIGNMTVAPISTESQLGGSSSGLAASQCQRGWLVYDVPTGVTPTFVEFTGTTAGLGANSVVKWTIPA